MAIVIDKEGLEQLRAGRPVQSQDVHELLHEAQRAVRDGELVQAESMLQEALLVDPNRASVWSLVGAVEDELGDVTTARSAYRYALSLADDDHTALALARLHASVGEWDDAVAVATDLALAGHSEDLRQAATRLAHDANARKVVQ
ncbi:MAG: hypothetical protein H7Z43_09150 [Clostridia bacterium]|nr:hypothetical protein [Deltaproteobacteria bacterium]